ncbi:hypothetical protein [Noviherbaspirillum aerium]|uniref:hypothetical protein n=1 Tax=Noviherbaspirillum aerium TaxID=2588497 RepID=UPI00124BFBB1|nr:hypothetical protein [Noviherbaspirillum aerium]
MTSKTKLNHAITKLLCILLDIVDRPQAYVDDTQLITVFDEISRVEAQTSLSSKHVHNVQTFEKEEFYLTETFIELNHVFNQANNALQKVRKPKSASSKIIETKRGVSPTLARNVLKQLYSVYHTYRLFQGVLLDPKLFIADVALKEALKSQHRMVAMQRPEDGINASSLNTVKDYAGLLFSGGFQWLDDMRKLCIEAFQKHELSHRPRKVTRSSLALRVSELKDENDLLLGDLWNVTRALFKAMKNARSYAKESKIPSIVARCAAEEVELRAIVAMARVKSRIKIIENE